MTDLTVRIATSTQKSILNERSDEMQIYKIIGVIVFLLIVIGLFVYQLISSMQLNKQLADLNVLEKELLEEMGFAEDE